MKALIFAAGLGTRLLPLTQDRPKALVEINSKPMVYWQLKKLYSQGFDKVVINLHSFGKMIVDYVDCLIKEEGWHMQVEYSEEYDLLRETGGGIKRARRFLSDSCFLVHNVDIFSNLNLGEVYSIESQKMENSPNHIASVVVSSRKTDRNLIFDRNNNLVGWLNHKTKQIKSPYKDVFNTPYNQIVEESSFSLYPFAGIHIISPHIFPIMESFCEKFSIVDFYLSIAKDYKVMCVVADNLKIFDVGKIEQIQAANEFVKCLINS